MARQPKVPRISFRSEGISSVIHQERAIPSQTSHPPSCTSSSSAVELPQMSGGTRREQSSTDASDSSMCGSNCASRLERGCGSSRKISRRKGNFLVAPIPVADIPRSHSFCSPVMSDDSGRNSREETTGSKGDEKSTPLGESGTTGCGEQRKVPQPETLAESDTSDLRSTSKRPPTGGWATRISDCPRSIEQRAFRENAHLEWMTCLSCGARWSRKTGRDDIQVKMGLITEQPQSTPPCPGCASTTRLQQMTNKTETFFGCSRFSPVQKSGFHISYYGITCFTVCALVFSSSAYGAGDGTGRLSRIGRELQNIECSSRTSCITTGATIPSEKATASFVFWHHGSRSTTGDRSTVSRPTAEGQGGQGSSDLA